MPEERTRKEFYYAIPDFGAGVQTFLPHHKKPINSLVEAQNAFILENGSVVKRAGFRRVVNHAVAETTWRPTALVVGGEGTQKKLYAGYRLSNRWVILWFDGGTFQKIETSILTPGDRWHNGIAFVKDGPSAPSPDTYFIYWSHGDSDVRRITVTNYLTDPTFGTSFGDTNSDPRRGLVMFVDPYNRLWIGGIVTAPHEGVVQRSVTGEPQLFDRIALIHDFYSGTKNPQEVIAITGFKEQFIVIGQSSQIMMIGFGTASSVLDFETPVVARDIGFGTPKAIANVGEDIIFVDQDGQVRSLQLVLSTGGATVRRQPLSFPIQDQIANNIDRTKVIRSNGEFFNGSYWHSFVNSSGAFTTYVFNWDSQTWSGPMIIFDGNGDRIYPTHKISFVGDLPGSSGGNRSMFYIYGQSPNNLNTAYIHRYDDSVYVDTTGALDRAIDMVLTTKAYDFDFTHQEKTLRWLEIEFRRNAGTGTGYFKVEARADFGAWHVVDAAVPFSSPNPERAKFSLRDLKRGRLFDFRITESSTTSRLEVLRMWVSGHMHDPTDN